jgi:hypothetical protein
MKNRKIRCKHCMDYFYPDNYNRHHQRYCCKDNKCRKASSAASSKEYRKKKSEDTRFRQKESERVKRWQSKNPNYRKDSQKKSKKVQKSGVLRDFAQAENLHSEITVLRDFANLQYAVMEGLIITLTGDVLRDDIDGFIRQMYDKSQEVSGKVPEKDFIMQFVKERTDNGKQDVNRPSP